MVYTGQELTYAINWHNTGVATAEDLVITDTLPAGTTLVPGSITGGGTSGGIPMDCSGLEAAAASSPGT